GRAVTAPLGEQHVGHLRVVLGRQGVHGGQLQLARLLRRQEALQRGRGQGERAIAEQANGGGPLPQRALLVVGGLVGPAEKEPRLLQRALERRRRVVPQSRQRALAALQSLAQSFQDRDLPTRRTVRVFARE